MKKEDYNAYLLSNTWRKKRDKRRRKDKDTCQTCGVTHGLEVHHRTYARLGHERMSDLITLCHHCHRAISASIRRRNVGQHWPDGIMGALRRLLGTL